MNTTLETRPGPPGTSSRASERAPATTCSTISAGGHVALQAALAGRAERAGHAAAGLGRDAHRDPARVAHQHRLDQGAVEQLPQRLAGGALVGLERAQRRHQVRQQRRRPARARWPAGRSVICAGVVDQPGEVVVRELLGPEPGQPELLEPRLALGRGRGRRDGAAAFAASAGSSKTRGRVLMGSLTTGHLPSARRAHESWPRASSSMTPTAGSAVAVRVGHEQRHARTGGEDEQDRRAGE